MTEQFNIDLGKNLVLIPCPHLDSGCTHWLGRGFWGALGGLRVDLEEYGIQGGLVSVRPEGPSLIGLSGLCIFQMIKPLSQLDSAAASLSLGMHTPRCSCINWWQPLTSSNGLFYSFLWKGVLLFLLIISIREHGARSRMTITRGYHVKIVSPPKMVGREPLALRVEKELTQFILK